MNFIAASEIYEEGSASAYTIPVDQRYEQRWGLVSVYSDASFLLNISQPRAMAGS